MVNSKIVYWSGNYIAYAHVRTSSETHMIIVSDVVRTANTAGQQRSFYKWALLLSIGSTQNQFFLFQEANKHFVDLIN